MGQDPAVIQQEIAATRERLGDTAGALADKAHVPARVSQTLDAFREGTAGRSPKDMLSADELRRATRGVAGYARENPFGLAIGAMAAGFIIGMLLPATEIEDERLGAVSDSVKAEAREAGHEALEYTKGVGQAHSPGAQRRRTLSRARRRRTRRSPATAPASALGRCPPTSTDSRLTHRHPSGPPCPEPFRETLHRA